MDGYLARGQELEVGHELADGGARVSGVTPELTLELPAAAVAQRTRAEMEIGALHLAAPVEQPVDFGEREEPHAVLREVVDDREEAREQPGVVADDLIDQPRVAANGEETEGRFEFSERGLDVVDVELRIAAGGACEAALEAAALDHGHEGRQERSQQEPEQRDHEREGDRYEQQRYDPRHHPAAAL